MDINNKPQRNRAGFPSFWKIGEQKFKFGMGDASMGKVVSSVSIIGGADSERNRMAKVKGREFILSVMMKNERRSEDGFWIDR